jgi:hypothetical protein
MFSCGAEGVISLLVEIERGQVMDPSPNLSDDPYEPVLVHMTSCKAHARAVHKYLRARAGVPPVRLGTEYLLRHWGQIVEPIELPVFGLVDMRTVAG